MQLRLDNLAAASYVLLSWLLLIHDVHSASGDLDTHTDGGFLRETTGINPRPTTVTGLVLINSIDNSEVASLNNGGTINLYGMSPSDFKIRADTSGSVRSVRFDRDGKTSYKMDNRKPFVLGARKISKLGLHTVTATPFSERRGAGDEGTSLTVNFTVINEHAHPTQAPVKATPSPNGSRAPRNYDTTCPPTNSPWTEIPPSVVTIANSNASVLCRIILVVGKDQIPVARSYDASNWHQYSGAFSSMDITCRFGDCTFELGQPIQGGQYMLVTTDGYPLANEQISARFFESATFGMTKGSITSMAQDMESTDNAIATWISEQMNQETTPMSSLREFYRKYANGKSLRLVMPAHYIFSDLTIEIPYIDNTSYLRRILQNCRGHTAMRRIYDIPGICFFSKRLHEVC